ncbi:MAG: hypothetical protein IJ614_04235 [Prevotella sp.]|nr:hypothetical protein [Prevotella sp.]
MRNLLLLGALIMTSGGMMAQTSLTSTNAKVVPGFTSQGDAIISFQVPATIGGWQMVLSLPEGLSLVEGSADVTVNGQTEKGSAFEGVTPSSLHKSHKILGGTNKDGDAVLICFPTTADAALSAQSGQLCTVKVKADASFAGTGQVTVKSFLAADPDGSTTQYTMASPITFDVVALKGDVNGSGDVTISDAQVIINNIVAGTFDTKADTNSDGNVTISDAQIVINEINM